MNICTDECPSTMGGSCACKNEATISCRVCGIDNWINCGCYYLHGGAGGLGDMNASIYDCPECGWVTECYPTCPIKKESK